MTRVKLGDLVVDEVPQIRAILDATASIRVGDRFVLVAIMGRCALAPKFMLKRECLKNG
jgi:hypothetical protein